MPILPDDLEPTFRGFLTDHGEGPLAYTRWDHPSPRGRVVLAPGYGEHGERYRHTAHWLHAQGWSVSALDHRGFGRSGGIRGDANGIRGFVEDLALFLRHERQADAVQAGAQPLLAGGFPVAPPPVCPQVLLGHSFGGLVALLTLLWHADTLDGLILTSPALKLRELPFHLKALAKLLLWVAPHRPVDLPNDKSLVCNDPVFVQRYWDDPLCHRFVTAAFLEALAEGRQELLNLGAELDRPILLLEAGQDTVVDPDVSETLWGAVRPGLLERHRLAGFRHEILHDLGRQEAETLASLWLDRVFSKTSGTKTPLTAMLN
jgi:alpha-beta hydrolase superfamily lysophospholipase